MSGAWPKRILYGFVLAVTVLMALRLSLLATGDLAHLSFFRTWPYVHLDQSWRPGWLATPWPHNFFDVRWFGLALLPWLRHPLVGIVTFLAVATFGFPLLVALVAFIAYFGVELVLWPFLFLWRLLPVPGGPAVVNPPRIYGVTIDSE